MDLEAVVKEIEDCDREIFQTEELLKGYFDQLGLHFPEIRGGK